MLLLRAHVLALGYSGVRPLIVDRMVEMLNRELIPAVPEQGSLGASGDLAPLANLALPLIGQGELLSEDGSEPAGAALAVAGLAPHRARGEGGPGARQRDAGHARGRDPGAPSRRRTSRARPTSPRRCPWRRRSAPTRRSTNGCSGCARTPGQVASASNLRRLLAGLADPVVASREPAPGAGRVFAPVRAPGARRDARRARLRRGRVADRGRRRLGQPDRAARRRRGPLGRQLPRPAGRGRARHARALPRWASRASASAGCTGCWIRSGTTACLRS